MKQCYSGGRRNGGTTIVCHVYVESGPLQQVLRRLDIRLTAATRKKGSVFQWTPAKTETTVWGFETKPQKRAFSDRELTVAIVPGFCDQGTGKRTHRGALA
jgi:hypothetical protein